MQTKWTIYIIIGLITALFFAWLLNQFVFSPRAAQNSVTVTAAPKTGTIAASGSGDVEFIVQPDKTENKISGVDLRFTAKGAAITEMSSCSTTGGDTSLFTELISNITGTTARKSCVSLNKDSQLPGTVVVKIKFSCSGPGQASVGIDTQSSQIIGNISEVQYGFGNVDTAQFTCGDGAQSGPGASISFEPTDCTMNVGGKCLYKLKVSGNQTSDKISGYHAVISFDPTIVQAQKSAASSSASLRVLGNPVPAISLGPSITGGPISPPAIITGVPTGPMDRICSTDDDCKKIAIANGTCQVGQPCPTLCDTVAGQCLKVPPSPGNPQPTFPAPGGPGGPIEGCVELQNSIDNEKGQIRITYACIKSAKDLPQSISSTLTFSGKADGEGKLSVTSSEVVGPTTGNIYPVKSTDGTYKVGKGGADGNVSLVVRLQGVTKKPKAKDTVKMKVGAGDGGLVEPVFTTVELKVGDDGLWRGSANLPIPAGPNYKILLKGEKHMQKKICTASPKEDFPGAYSCDKGKITISGNTTIDASGVVLLVGDLDPQDGISNAHDQSLVRNMLGRSDDECKQLADVNYDGVCNAIDHSLMIAALSVRYDDQ